jgi:hypothetical protein
MNTEQQNRGGWGFKLSFIINTIAGSLLLLFAMVAQVFELVFSPVQGQIAPWFIVPAMTCWFIASLHYSKYLSLKIDAVSHD